MSPMCLIYSCLAKRTVVLAEHTPCTSGNFSIVAGQCLQQLPPGSSKCSYSCDGHTFNFLIDGEFAFLVIADESAGRSVPFVFLELVKYDFNQRYGERDENKAHRLADEDLLEDPFSFAYALDTEFGPRLKEHMQCFTSLPDETSELSELKLRNTEVKEIVMDIEKLEYDIPLSMLTLPSPGESMNSNISEQQPWKDRKELRRTGKLGSGASARVYLCRSIIDGKDYALKRIPFSEDREEMVLREARIFSSLNHPHILRYYQAWTEDDHGKLSEWSDDSARSDLSNSLVLYIAMEYCPRTLATYLSDRERVDCEVSLKMFRQVLSATEYMHGLGVVHVDLHPKNIFLDASGNIKVGDFDCAVSISDGPVRKPEWLGPMYHRCSQDEYLFVQTDVYSLGVLMVELLWKFETGFERHNILTGFKEGKVPPGWEHRKLTDFVVKMLSTTFYDRPRIERIKQRLEGLYLG